MDTEVIADLLIEFVWLMAELLILFAAISFLVGLLQVYVSNDRVKSILTRPNKLSSSVLGALLGSVTPFCSCSTIPILVGLFRSGAPFCGAISFLLTSPILNPALISMMLLFFGVKVTVVYTIGALLFAIGMGLLLDRLGFEKYVKKVKVTGGRDGRSWEDLEGTFWQKQREAFGIAWGGTWGLMKGLLPYLVIGAAIGAFIHGVVPVDLLAGLNGHDALFVPLAALIGIPMYVRAETMIPIAGALVSKGVSTGVVMALIIGGSGASIPEVSLLSSIFHRRMVVTFVLCVFSIAVITGYAICLMG